MSQETIERTFTVSTPARLNVRNIVGLVEIQPGDEGQISVVAVKHLDRGDAQHTRIVIEQQADGSVRVETKFDDILRRMFNHQKPCQVDYAIRVPRECAVKASGVVSDVSVRALAGDFAIDTVSGDINLADLKGRLDLDSVSGNIRGKRLAGAVRAKTVSGDVRLVASSVPSIESSTMSGDVWLETPLGDGPYRFASASGAVSLIVPASTGCEIEIKGMSSRFKSDLPLASRYRSGRTLHAVVQNGGPRVHFKTMSGDLRIACAEEQPGAADASQPDAPTFRDLLDCIGRGELTVDEALRTQWTA